MAETLDPTGEPQAGGGWWRMHPAYPDLVRAFSDSTSVPGHLAFLALRWLGRSGWQVVREAHQTHPYASWTGIDQAPDRPDKRWCCDVWGMVGTQAELEEAERWR